MASFAKPDNTLKRAEELINVGQKQDALQVLHDLIKSRRYRAWQKTHEKIMFKYVELCVELKRGRFAKDGLIQYRNICQQVNVSSFEEVIKYFMDLSTKKVEVARSQAEALEEALDVDDLEAGIRPGDLMLSSVGGEKGNKCSDRASSFKFLWETYQTVLDILKNNSKLMALYADTAHHAFQFCKQYKRKTEFRRLCEIIRNHLANLIKYKDQRDQPDLSAPENLQLYLDTRFEQLIVATELKLWQEAFRSVEDIYGLTSVVKKVPKPSLMAAYYGKLIDICWVSYSHLYHAYAWFKLFQLQKSFNKNLSQKDLQLIASSVLLAALAAPPYDYTKTASHLELEREKERNTRMYNLIGFNVDVKPETSEVLSRSILLKDLVSKGVMTYVTSEVKDLYHLLENEFPPLDLASKVQLLLTKISKLGGKLSSMSCVPEVQLSQYVPALEEVATLRLLQQVSHVYQTMKVETLTKMVPFFDFLAVERILVDAVKHKFVAMKVDHRKGAITFGDLGLQSDHLQGHLNVFAENLNRSWFMMFPSSKKGSKLSDMLPSLGEIIQKEHKRLLARKSIIEKRKEEQERQEREEETKTLQEQKKAKEAERRRLETEFKERKQQRILRDIEEREREEVQTLLKDAEKFINKNRMRPIIDGNVTKQTVIELALQQQVRERQEMEKKLQKLVKRMDHLERAKREEAAPLIEAAFHRRLAEEKLLHERQNQDEIDNSRDSHEGKVREKYRLQRVMEHKIQFAERVMDHRQADYDRLKAEREERLSQVLEACREEREIKRKMLYYVRTETERLNKLRQEEADRKREEAERKKKEEAEKKAKQDEIYQKQRQRDQEVEEKARQEAILRGTLIDRSSQISGPEITAPPPAPTPVPAAAAARPETSAGRYVTPWRRSEPAAQASAQAPAPPAQSDRRTSRRNDNRGAPPSDRW